MHLGQLKRFNLRELQVASDNFSNRNILGRGGFGKVYKGRLADGTLVAIKRLKEERSPGGELQFQTEVYELLPKLTIYQKFLANLQHDALSIFILVCITSLFTSNSFASP